MNNRLVVGISPQFKSLQRYLTSAPDGMSATAFETSIGYPIKKHDEEYTDRQITSNVLEIKDATIRPFTLGTFFAVEAGDNLGKQVKNKLIEQFGSSDFVEIQKAIDNNTLTKEQIEDLKENLTNRILEIIGP